MFIADDNSCTICGRKELKKDKTHWCKGGLRGSLFMLILVQYRYNGGPVSTSALRDILSHPSFDMAQSRITKVIKLLKAGDETECENRENNKECDEKCSENHSSVTYRGDTTAPRSNIFWINQKGVDLVNVYIDKYRLKKKKVGTEIKKFFKLDAKMIIKPNSNA